MVALPTPAMAATFSMHSPSTPCSANTQSAASMMARSACWLRGRPGRRRRSAGAVPAPAVPACSAGLCPTTVLAFAADMALVFHHGLGGDTRRDPGGLTRLGTGHLGTGHLRTGHLRT